MINRLYHAGSDSVVQFSCNPLRGTGAQVDRYQLAGYDSGAATYVYNKNARQRTQGALVYPQQSAAVRDALLNFLTGRNGDKALFTWYDHAGNAHTVRFSTGHVAYKETTAGRYRLELALTEMT